jgi:ferric-dicitrate binding protein FerR (iron transport regulator)
MKEAAERILDRIHHQINLETLERTKKTKTVKRILNFYSKIAAILLIPLIVYSLYKTDNSAGSILPEQKMAYAEIVSPPGARTKFELPDGSTGWLNSASKLKFPVKFSGDERKLNLTGEAWFSVVKNPDMTFVLNASGIEFVAVGTKLNISSYTEQQDVEVTLESGKVLIKRKTAFSTKQIAELTPGEHVVVSRENTKIKKEEKVKSQQYTAWRNGKLVIRDDKMTNVVKKLERWYNVKIDIKDKEIEDYVYRATFQDESIDEILRLLKLTSPIDYKVKKRKVLKDGTYTKREIELFLKKNS